MSKKIKIANDRTAKTPGKYIEVYELHGDLPKKWLDSSADEGEYENQMHIVGFYTDKDNSKQGITLFSGKDKQLSDTFKALKVDRIRSKGRACGRSIVESLFEEQVWANYSEIKIKDLLDNALSIFQTDSDEYGNQKLSSLKTNTVLKHEQGRPLSKLDGSLQNLPQFHEYQQKKEQNARIIGSASEAQLGTNPASGTPFALQNLVVQQGQGIHEYRQGKIATFFADVLYRDFILKFMVNELNKGKTFSEELSVDELIEISETISKNIAEKKIVEMIFNGETVTEELRALITEEERLKFKEGGNRKFFKVVEGELDKIPMSVMVNVKGKQKNMAQNADKITNVLREIMKNPQAFQQKGIAKAFNQLLEESGMNPIDFSGISTQQEQATSAPPEQVVNNQQ